MILQLILITYLSFGVLTAITGGLASHNGVWPNTFVEALIIIFLWLPLILLAVIDIHYNHKH